MTEVLKRDSHKSALLIVDMQKGVVSAAHDRAKVIANINFLVNEARTKHVPVLWVQHSAEDMKHDSENWKIVDELKPLECEIIIHKVHGDSFEATNLETELDKLGVRKLIVTGAQTDACIRSTIHGAPNRTASVIKSVDVSF